MIEEEETARPQQRREDENGAVMELANMLLAMKLEKQGQGAAQPQQEAVEWEVNTFTGTGRLVFSHSCFCFVWIGRE